MANNPFEAIHDWRTSLCERIYTLDVKNIAAPLRPFVYIARIAMAISRDLADGQLNMRAMSLVYTTLLSLVPILALSFSVLKGFGVHNQIEPALLNVLSPLGDQRIEITDRVIDFVDNIKVGVLGVFGLAFLIYTVVTLMSKIEHAFNYTWNVSQSRRLAARFSDYLSVLLIGPLLIFVSVGITASVSNAALFETITGMDYIADAYGSFVKIIPFMMMSGAFAFIYIFMPNTRVRLVPAFTGGVVTTVMWKLLGFLFATVVASSANYSAIYSAFATLIIFMIWLYFGWLVLLIGASIAYYVQNPSNVTLSRQNLEMSNEMREQLAMSILSRVAVAQYEGQEGWSIQRLADSLKLPIRVIERSVEILDAQGILVQERERPYALVAHKPLDQLTVAGALKAIRTQHSDRPHIVSRARSEKKTAALMAQIDEVTAKALEGVSVRDWALSQTDVKEQKATKPKKAKVTKAKAKAKTKAVKSKTAKAKTSKAKTKTVTAKKGSKK